MGTPFFCCGWGVGSWEGGRPSQYVLRCRTKPFWICSVRTEAHAHGVRGGLPFPLDVESRMDYLEFEIVKTDVHWIGSTYDVGEKDYV